MREARAKAARMKRPLVSFWLGLLSAGCAAVTDRSFGTASYPPLPPTAPVSMFRGEEEIKGPYIVVGRIYYDDPDPLLILGPDDALEPLKREARALGANGLILGLAEPVESGMASRGIYAEALAVRLAGEGP